MLHPHRQRLALGLGLGLSMAITLGFGLRWSGDPEQLRLSSPEAAASPPAEAAPETSAGVQPEPATPAPAEDPPADGDLAARLDALLDAAEFLESASIGVSVIDLSDGSEVYARAADTALNPASNVKLVTTAAALARLGPEHRFATRVWVGAGQFVDGQVKGKLYLQGGGDPSLVTGEIYELAGQLQAAGVTTIQGPIIVDASRFDHDGLPPGFDQKDEFASHRAPGGAMSVNYNTYEVFARPAALAGEPPTLSVQPPIAGIELDPSRATTVEGNRNKLWVSTVEEGDKTIVRFHGEVGIANGRSSYRYPVSDPSRYAGQLLALALEQRGIEIRKTTVSAGQVPSGSKLIATFRSESLSELCRSVNKWSNNFMAEQILRALAPDKGASAEDALVQLRAYTEAIGMPQAGLVLGNGSGLYANNMVSPAAMTHLLGHVYADFRYRSDYLASLAVMGTEGTATSRLGKSQARGWVRVKTGTLNDVSALSGYAGAVNRAPFAFSILLNDLERKHRGRARALQDDIAELLAAEAAKSS